MMILECKTKIKTLKFIEKGPLPSNIVNSDKELKEYLAKNLIATMEIWKLSVKVIRRPRQDLMKRPANSKILRKKKFIKFSNGTSRNKLLSKRLGNRIFN